MFVSAALVSSFIPFTQLRISHLRIGRTICFTPMSFGSTHAFKILCNSHVIFLSGQKIGPSIEGSIKKLAQMLLLLSHLTQCQYFKTFTMVWIGKECGNQVWPISLNISDDHCLPLKLAGLQCDPTHVIFRSPFSNHTQFIVVPILFLEKFCQTMHYCGDGVSSLTD